jgi:hypothetical protein
MIRPAIRTTGKEAADSKSAGVKDPNSRLNVSVLWVRQNVDRKDRSLFERAPRFFAADDFLFG